MRPVAKPPLNIRGIAFGGPRPLFCVPLVAKDVDDLRAQASIAHGLAPEVIEWRADSFVDLTEVGVVEILTQLRRIIPGELLIFTLRIKDEGGKNEMSQSTRSAVIEAAAGSGLVDLIDVELLNGSKFIDPILAGAHSKGARVMLSFHDFEATPDNETLKAKLASMIQHRADIAKIACMPREPGDVLRLLQVTLEARQAHPGLPLCTMSMGGLGCLSRVAGFLYGSDMAFAVGREISAPGQIPIQEARSIAESLLRYA